ncbi:MAG: MBL fold metallo-hydrolase [Elusimicrobia bacterium]|nr:MBL fold metallo-hydrolase [Elusimicrobiota bacterium]
MQRLRKGLYLLESGGFVNAYLIEGPRGLTLVDTGHPRAAEQFCREIALGGFALKEIEQILVTHSHFDHAGGAAYLLDKHRVKVYAHPDDIAAIQGKAPQRPFSLSRWVSGLVQRLWFPYRPLEVVVPLRQSETLRALPQWQVLHTPGHTPGSLSLYQPTDFVLICGDALSNRKDKLSLSPRPYNHDNELAAKSAKRLSELPCEVLCCGHGPVIRAAAGQRIHELVETFKA